MRKTLPRRALAVLLTVLLMVSLVPAALAAEDDDPDNSDTPTNPPAATQYTIRLPATSLTVAVGDTYELTANVSPAPKEGDSVSWTSDNTRAATVTSSGNPATITVPTDAKVGTKATITATCGTTGKAICEVTVGDPIVKSLSVKLYKDAECKTELTPDNPAVSGTTNKYKMDGTDALELNGYQTVYAKAVAVWSDGEPEGKSLLWRQMTWSVDGSGAISVQSKSGFGEVCPITLHGRTQGSGTLTVKADYRNTSSTGNTVSGSANCAVTVGNINDVVITEYGVKTREVHMTVGDPSNAYKDLRAYLAMNNEWKETEDSDIKWSFVDEKGDPITTNIVSLDKTTGTLIRVTPKNVGSVRLRATYTKDSNCFSEVVCVVTKYASTDPSDPTTPPSTTTDTKLPDDVTPHIKITTPSDDPHTMEPGSENVEISVTFTVKGSDTVYPGEIQVSRSGNSAIAVYEPTRGTKYELPLNWTSSDKNIAEVKVGGRQFSVTADQPGEAKLTVTLSDKTGVKATGTFNVVVKGFALRKDSVTLYENDSMDLSKVVEAFGGANISELTCWSDSSTVAAYADGKIAAYFPGTTTFTVSDPNRGFRASFEVEVKADPNATIPSTGTITIKDTETKSFADLLSSFQRQAGGHLSYITGINMNSSLGAVFYKYNSNTGSGTGVGAENYYHPYRSGGVPYGQRSLEDLTFVPKKGAAGQVTINYTAVSEEGKNYACKLLITVDPQAGSSAGISLSTDYNTPLKFSGDDFSRVCREHLGSRLSYVTFSQPPERQGALYTNYVDAGNYGRKVEMNTRYNQKALDDIWFVPAPGYNGNVTVYYTVFAVDGKSYTGQVNIQVAREDLASIGGLTYDIAKGGVARFDDADFNNYCRTILKDSGNWSSQTLSYITFDALPAESEGVLYSGYSSATNLGSRAAVGTVYYNGSRSPRIDYLAFVPAENFVGTVKIPFTGCTTDGTRFNGNVEVNVRGGVAVSVGDITYVCAPGKTVRFDDTDFNRLSRRVTGESLSYITFRSLPGSSAGTLYYNSARANTSTNYRNGSSTPRIDNLSFTASKNFSGTVDIPFTARDIYGGTFTGVVTIGSSAAALSGAGSAGGYWGNSTVFTDMAGYSAVQQAAVDFIYRRGITHGLTPTLYGPQNSIRRGDFALMVYTAFGFGSSGTGQAFADVAPGVYYGNAVNALYSRGVVSGIGGGYYAPDSTLTRQDAICMVQRAMRAAGRAAGDGSVSALYSYSDGGSVAGYAQGAMAFAVQQGYLPTYSGWLNPTAPLTRIDMAEILYRVLG